MNITVSYIYITSTSWAMHLKYMCWYFVITVVCLLPLDIYSFSWFWSVKDSWRSISAFILRPLLFHCCDLSGIQLGISFILCQLASVFYPWWWRQYVSKTLESTCKSTQCFTQKINISFILYIDYLIVISTTEATWCWMRCEKSDELGTFISLVYKIF